MTHSVRYWRYRAYDAELRIHNGIAESVDFGRLAVKLRQDGLQLIGASTIDQGTYRAELRLQKIIQRSQRSEPCIPDTKATVSTIRQLVCWLANIFLIK